MALVNVTNVVVLDNPTAFLNPLTFEVTFECLQELDAGELQTLLFDPCGLLCVSFLHIHFALRSRMLVSFSNVARMSQRAGGAFTLLNL